MNNTSIIIRILFAVTLFQQNQVVELINLAIEETSLISLCRMARGKQQLPFYLEIKPKIETSNVKIYEDTEVKHRIIWQYRKKERLGKIKSKGAREICSTRSSLISHELARKDMQIIPQSIL
jgi:hypothetical protein